MLRRAAGCAPAPGRRAGPRRPVAGRRSGCRGRSRRGRRRRGPGGGPSRCGVGRGLNVADRPVAAALLEVDGRARRAGGGDRRGGEDGDLRGHARPEPPRRGGGGAGARGAGDAGRGPGARQQMGQQGRGAGDGQRRDERGEVRLALPDRRLEAAARAAVAQVRPQAPAAQHAAVGVRQRPADVLTGHGAPLGALVQRRPSLEDGLLDGARRRVQDDRDLVVAQAVELPQDQRGALTLRQVRQVRLELGQAAAVLHLLGQPVRPQRRRRLQLRRRPPAAQERDRLVVRDPEEPRPDLEVPLLLLEGGEGLRHGALQGVLGVLVVAQDRPRVAVELLVMAPVEGRERPLVPPQGERPQGRRPAQAVQGHPPRNAGGRHPWRVHSSHIGNARARLESGSIRPA